MRQPPRPTIRCRDLTLLPRRRTRPYAAVCDQAPARAVPPPVCQGRGCWRPARLRGICSTDVRWISPGVTARTARRRRPRPGRRRPRRRSAALGSPSATTSRTPGRSSPDAVSTTRRADAVVAAVLVADADDHGRAPRSPALDGEVEEVRRAGDARVVVADRPLAQRGQRLVVEVAGWPRRRGAGRPRSRPGSARSAARSSPTGSARRRRARSGGRAARAAPR